MFLNHLSIGNNPEHSFMIIETEILVYLLYNEEKRKYYCFIGISQNHSIGFIFDKVNLI